MSIRVLLHSGNAEGTNHPAAEMATTHADSPAVTAAPTMKMTKMLLSLIAWFALTLILRLVRTRPVGWAGAAALTIAVVFLLVNARGGLKILDVSSVVTFAVITVIGFAGGPTIQEGLHCELRAGRLRPCARPGDGDLRRDGAVYQSNMPANPCLAST